MKLGSVQTWRCIDFLGHISCLESLSKGCAILTIANRVGWHHCQQSCRERGISQRRTQTCSIQISAISANPDIQSYSIYKLLQKSALNIQKSIRLYGLIRFTSLCFCRYKSLAVKKCCRQHIQRVMYGLVWHFLFP